MFTDTLHMYIVVLDTYIIINIVFPLVSGVHVKFALGNCLFLLADSCMDRYNGNSKRITAKEPAYAVLTSFELRGIDQISMGTKNVA